MSFLNGSSSSDRPFSIDDAFDIPEDIEEEAAANAAVNPSAIIPIICNGQLRLESNVENSNNVVSNDGASLIRMESSRVGGRCFKKPAPLKYWWLHPKIRSNSRVVLAALLLMALGLSLVTAGVVVYCVPSFQGIHGIVFIIAGLICFIPGIYHIGYIYLAVKGKRGFEFSHLPIFNS